MWHTYSNVYLDIFRELLDRFRATHPSISVAEVKFDGVAPLETKLRTTALADYPDLVLAPEFSVRRFVDAGKFVGAEECLRAAGVALAPLLPVVRRTWTLDGELWAVPVNVSAPLLFYNRKLFVDAQIARPPRDRAELEETSRRLVAAGARTGLVIDSNMAIWLTEQWPAQRNQPLLPQSDAAARATTADDFRWVADMERQHLVENVGANPSGYDDMLQLTTPTQPSGMALHSSAALGVARVLSERGTVQADDVLVAPLPGPGPGALVGGSAAWIAHRRDHGLDAAALLAGFLAAPAQQATWNTRGGYLPSTPDALAEPELVEAWGRYPQLRVAYEQAVGTPDTPVFSLSLVGPRQEIRDVNKKALAAVEGGSDAKRAVDDASRDADQLIRAYDATAPAR